MNLPDETHMNTHPRITIITPSFNQAAFLEHTIRSVLLQSYPNLEFGIIDGGSTDGSIDIIRRYERELDFVVIEKDRGQSEAINKGLRRADGAIVGWLNSDDTLLPGALWRVGAHFHNTPACNWLVGCCRAIDAQGRGGERLTPKGTFTLAGALIRRGGFEVPQPATFFRRELIERLGLLDETLHHCMDFELWCRFLAAGVTPALTDAELATYRFHDASKSCAQKLSFVSALIDIERRYAHHLRWRDRLTLMRLMGYQRRAHAIATSPRRSALWRNVIRRPWWLASQQVLRALCA